MYVIFLFTYLPNIIGYGEGGVGLKTWQNRGCCSYIGVFWILVCYGNIPCTKVYMVLYNIDRSTHRILDNIDDNDKTGLSYSYGGVAYKEEHRLPGGGERLTLVTVSCTLLCYQKANEKQFKLNATVIENQ